MVNATPQPLYPEAGWAKQPLWAGVENLTPHRDSTHITPSHRHMSWKINDISPCLASYSTTSGSLSPRHGASSGCGWRNGLQGVCPPATVLGEVILTPRGKIVALLRNRHTCLGPGLIIWYDLSTAEGKRPLGTPRPTWEDIKMDLQDVRWGGMDWIDLAQDRDRWRALVDAIMNLRVPQNARNFLTS